MESSEALALVRHNMRHYDCKVKELEGRGIFEGQEYSSYVRSRDHAIAQEYELLNVGNLQAPTPITTDVYFGRQSQKIKFRSYDELLSQLQRGMWCKSLCFNDFIISAIYDDGKIIDLSNSVPIGSPIKLVVKTTSKGFSQYVSANDQMEALSYIHALFAEVSPILHKNATEYFPDQLEKTVCAENVLIDSVESINQNISLRVRVVNRNLSTEYTMREFISPVLIGAVDLAKRIMGEEYEKKLSLACERNIIGLRAHGPVDYSIMLEYFDICLTEVKKENVDSGILQNLLQQHCSLEFLTNTAMAPTVTGEMRKRKFDESFNRLRRHIQTYGIVSTGTEWRFCTCLGTDEGTEIHVLDAISMDLEKEDVRRGQLTRIVSIIVNIVLNQMKAFSSTDIDIIKRLQLTYPTAQGFFDSQATICSQIASENTHSNEEDENDLCIMI